MNVNFAGMAYARTRGDIFFDPVLELEDVSLDAHTLATKYLRSFALLDRAARVELTVPLQTARWEGLLQGAPASREVEGFADPQVRLAVNLAGSPPMSAREFAVHRNAHPIETSVGAGLTLGLPLGQYDPDRMLNLGENRFLIRPEFGVEHRRGKWTMEGTGYASFPTDNDDFMNGKTRRQDPYFSAIGIGNYAFRPGLWLAAGLGYGYGGESEINGTAKGDAKSNLVTGLALGVPINRSVGLKFAYLGNRALAETGADSDTLTAAVSVLW